MDKSWNWPGARWWKCDLHLHTPASCDFRDQDASAEDWLKAARRVDLAAVAVTDHNTAAFIDRLLARDGELPVIFPGVELTVDSGIHLLVLFDRERGADSVKAFLGACGVPDRDWGQDGALASCSLIDALEKAGQQGAICLAPHAENRKGLLQELEGKALKQVIASPHLYGVEANDCNDILLKYVKGEMPDYQNPNGPLPILTFSDAHALNEIGRRTTWIKMTRPELEGLRLALLDGEPLSVRPGNSVADPNSHASCAIEEIEIRGTRYMGRIGSGADEGGRPFVVRFNPWLNAIIGGRGTGKSSLVELLRVVLRRKNELPAALRKDYEDRIRTSTSRHDQGLLLEQTQIRVIYRKDGARFRISWDPAGALPSIEEETTGGWRVGQGIVAERFPVRIYSQKQIFELASDPQALLGIVDRSTEVDRTSWQRKLDAEMTTFLSFSAETRSIEEQLKDKERLAGELEDVRHKLAMFEQADHASVLRRYQKRLRQERAVDDWLEELEGVGERLRTTLEEVAPTSFDERLFDAGKEGDQSLLAELRQLREKMSSLLTKIDDLTQKADSVAQTGRERLGKGSWRKAVDDAKSNYQTLVAELEEAGAGDPAAYSDLVQERQQLEARIRALTELEMRHKILEQQSAEILEKLIELRRELSKRRTDFLAKVLEGNTNVRILLMPYGARAETEIELRDLLAHTDRFDRDVDSLVHRIYTDSSRPTTQKNEALTRRESKIEALKNDLLALAHGQSTDYQLKDQRLLTLLQTLKPEQLDRLRCWFPKDTVEVAYSPQGDGKGFRPIEQASPGQKTAALLSFLLAYGEEPIILDQPEDDLDNELVYQLVVSQLRTIKRTRQMVVVTHNPNIVVHGDSELVLVFESKRGQTQIRQQGGLQERSVRGEICNVMEGGRDAFDKRYRRITLGSTHA